MNTASSSPLLSTSRAERLAVWAAAQRRWISVFMLGCLHGAVITSADSALARVWMLLHFAFFLLWQPFYSAERRLGLLRAAIVIAVAALVSYSIKGWLLVIWVGALIGILGGKVFTLESASQRRFHWVAAFYLMAMLMVWIVPQSVLRDAPVPEGAVLLASSVLPTAIVLLAFMPYSSESEQGSEVYDFFYSVMVFQLVALIVLGSITFARYTGGQYYMAVVYTLLGTGASLLLFALLWTPRFRFSGLRTHFSRYLLSVGMPFERWMRRVAEHAQSDATSERFLEHALQEIVRLPWIKGCAWRTPDEAGTIGERTPHSAAFDAADELALTFYSDTDMPPALVLHSKLLAQVVGEFYAGKRREEALKRHAYVQAVHETGARLTHDVKNLLQSLYAMSAAGQSLAPQERTAYADTLARQVPQLAKRLRATLDRLHAPQSQSAGVRMPVRMWWPEALERWSAPDVALDAHIERDADVPVNVFDAFIDNALDNIRRKSRQEPGIRASISLNVTDRVALSVSDNGSAIESTIARSVLREPIARDDGSRFGLGLYQTAQLARQAGYELRLVANEPGNVEFELVLVDIQSPTTRANDPAKSAITPG